MALSGADRVRRYRKAHAGKIKKLEINAHIDDWTLYGILYRQAKESGQAGNNRDFFHLLLSSYQHTAPVAGPVETNSSETSVPASNPAKDAGNTKTNNFVAPELPGNNIHVNNLASRKKAETESAADCHPAPPKSKTEEYASRAARLLLLTQGNAREARRLLKDQLLADYPDWTPKNSDHKGTPLAHVGALYAGVLAAIKAQTT